MLAIINEPSEYQDMFIEIFGGEFDITYMPTLTHQERKKFKELVGQKEILGAVCGLDASGVTAQRAAWFSARQIFRMDIPIVCFTEQEYGERAWKRLQGRFPELNAEIPYFALTAEEDFSVIKSALQGQIAENEKRKRKRNRPWCKLGRFIKNRFAIS